MEISLEIFIFDCVVLSNLATEQEKSASYHTLCTHEVKQEKT